VLATVLPARIAYIVADLRDTICDEVTHCTKSKHSTLCRINLLESYTIVLYISTIHLLVKSIRSNQATVDL
jgi:hypothetical protein